MRLDDGLWVCTGCGPSARREASGRARAHARHRAVGHAATASASTPYQGGALLSCDDYVISDPHVLRAAGRRSSAPSEPSAAIVDVAGGAAAGGAAHRPQFGQHVLHELGRAAARHCDAFRGFFLDFIKQQAPLALGPVGIKREGHHHVEGERRGRRSRANWRWRRRSTASCAY